MLSPNYPLQLLVEQYLRDKCLTWEKVRVSTDRMLIEVGNLQTYRRNYKGAAVFVFGVFSSNQNGSFSLSGFNNSYQRLTTTFAPTIICELHEYIAFADPEFLLNGDAIMLQLLIINPLC